MEYEVVKKYVKEMVNSARWCRLLNVLQDNGAGCVDYHKPVNMSEIRTVIFWDIMEYLKRDEYGTKITDRPGIFNNHKFGAE
jgi:hypothetical protein